jgi:hypothetical protein
LHSAANNMISAELPGRDAPNDLDIFDVSEMNGTDIGLLHAWPRDVQLSTRDLRFTELPPACQRMMVVFRADI